MFMNLQKLTGVLAVARTARTYVKILFEFYVFNKLFNSLSRLEDNYETFHKMTNNEVDKTINLADVKSTFLHQATTMTITRSKASAKYFASLVKISTHQYNHENRKACNATNVDKIKLLH